MYMLNITLNSMVYEVFNKKAIAKIEKDILDRVSNEYEVDEILEIEVEMDEYSNININIYMIDNMFDSWEFELNTLLLPLLKK